MSGARRLLFVCSRNRWRSPTAESVWRRAPDVAVRSAGTAASARRRVQEDDLRWADVVFAMEAAHAQQLRRAFPHAARAVEIVVLDIPDDYGFMDPELVAILQDAVAPWVIGA